MTQDEYDIKSEEALRDIPSEFHSAIRWNAWENGHAYGYDEVYIHLRDLVEALSIPIQEYTKRLQSGG
jgi:hypothetical protein